MLVETQPVPGSGDNNRIENTEYAPFYATYIEKATNVDMLKN
jgi:hypothetical protein